MVVLALLNNPLVLLALFLGASLLMIWRLEAMERKGFEGTVLGTLIMPYCSGFANLVFAYVMGQSGAGNGQLVLENSIVNNVTNLTLILGLSAVFSTAVIVSANNSKKKKGQKANAYPLPNQGHRLKSLNRLNLLFTLIALFLFSGTLWALGKDGTINLYDGIVLVSLFFFWQALHIFEILKNNIRRNQEMHWSIVIDLLLIGISAGCIYLSVDHLVTWVTKADHPVFSFAKLGWLSGALMVMPNAFLALYYARTDRHDIVFSSQIGDAHICIPMCVGLFALFEEIAIPPYFQTAIYILLGAGIVHFLSIAILGRIPRILGFGLLGAYGYFLYSGLVQ